jgi:hypothetical protein
LPVISGNHQGKDNVLLFPTATKVMKQIDGQVACKKRFGGLLNYYYLEAACVPRVILLFKNLNHQLSDIINDTTIRHGQGQGTASSAKSAMKSTGSNATCVVPSR